MKDKEQLDKILGELHDAQCAATEAYEKSAEEFWQGLSYEEKLKAFYSVCKRIYEGELGNKDSSYRYVLYDVFGFDKDAYAIGMSCGFFAIHNSIMNVDERFNAALQTGLDK